MLNVCSHFCGVNTTPFSRFTSWVWLLVTGRKPKLAGHHHQRSEKIDRIFDFYVLWLCFMKVQWYFFLATFAKWKSGQEKHLEYISANPSVGRGFRGVNIPGTSVGIRWTGKGIATEKLQHDSCNMYLFHILEKRVENFIFDRVKVNLTQQISQIHPSSVVEVKLLVDIHEMSSLFRA